MWEVRMAELKLVNVRVSEETKARWEAHRERMKLDVERRNAIEKAKVSQMTE